MPKVSVIIPVYNAEKFLRKCLESVLNQTFSDIEIICVNDGSTDKSLEILQSYKDKRIKILDKKNAGVSAARNDGLSAATGEYIHFIDADDWIDDDYYETLLAGARADIIASGFVSNTKFTNGIKYTRNHIVKTLSWKLWVSGAMSKSYVWRYLFRRKFLIKNKLKFRTDLISQEDTLFVLNAMALSDKLVIRRGAKYHYIMNTNSALNARDPEHQKKMDKHYQIGRKFRKDFAKKHNVLWVWVLRKFS
ncbi:MAG: glycosyltransferase [Rickettsiales bacterium]|jgi:glycosyltransferase involved in cell wall biosynthesis|nr:glycosyltransferase [Rickettsiales bacterium]